MSWKLTLHPSSDWARTRAADEAANWNAERLTISFEGVKGCVDREAAARLEAVAAIAIARVALLEQMPGEAA